MTMKYLVVALMALTFLASCGESPSKETTSKKTEIKTYVVKMDTNMTLSELAKANQIGEPYLRTQLGMPTKAGATIPLHQLRKNYKFTYERLEGIISKAKNRN